MLLLTLTSQIICVGCADTENKVSLSTRDLVFKHNVATAYNNDMCLLCPNLSPVFQICLSFSSMPYPVYIQDYTELLMNYLVVVLSVFCCLERGTTLCFVLLAYLILCDYKAIHSVVTDIYFRVLKFYQEDITVSVSF